METRRLRGVVVCTLDELTRDTATGLLMWAPFGGWRITLATGGQRATAREVERVHAAGRAVADRFIAARRDVFEAMAKAARS